MPGIRHDQCCYHHANMSVHRIPHYTPLLYSKSGVYRDVHHFLIFALKHRLWVHVRTASLPDSSFMATTWQKESYRERLTLDPCNTIERSLDPCNTIELFLTPGSAVACWLMPRTADPEVGVRAPLGSNRVLSLSKAHLLSKSTGNTQEVVSPSQHD